MIIMDYPIVSFLNTFLKQNEIWHTINYQQMPGLITLHP